ncbi:hypothetical protein ACTHGU_20600 [Chitinophagaceae bacterium MMS25-I14]
MKYAPIWLFAALVIFSQCHKTDKEVVPYDPTFCGTTMIPLDSTGYFAFGRAYGMCGGPNCATFFKIQNQKIYPDSMDHYNGNMYFMSAPLSNNAYQQALTVLYIVPSTLTNTADTTIGAPDSHDQGGYYFEYKASASAPVQRWRIDTDTTMLTIDIEGYEIRVGRVIDSL